MSLKIVLKSQFNQDLIHAVARIDERHHRALKRYMHCRDEIAIRFPGNVALFSRGRGWYRLECTGNNLNAEQRMAYVLKVIRRFMLDEERKTSEQIKLLMPTAINPGLRIATFSNAHSEGEYGYLGHAVEKPKLPAAQHRLAALANKFNSKRA